MYTMKTKILYLTLAGFIGLLISCTPTPVNNEKNVYKSPPIYGSGGEHVREPDNEKD